eukprot:Gb_21882 [translate_table: standard]
MCRKNLRYVGVRSSILFVCESPSNIRKVYCYRCCNCLVTERHRAMNMEVIELDTRKADCFSSKCRRKELFWFGQDADSHYLSDLDSVEHGIPIYSIIRVLDKIINETKGRPLAFSDMKWLLPDVPIIGAELTAIKGQEFRFK